MCCENGACRNAATRSDPPSLCNERTVHSGSSLRSARTSGLADARCGPSPGEVAARSAFARPIFTRAKPAAERTGLLSSSVRLQPSALGRLRAADRFAIAFASGHHIPATRRRFATNGTFGPRFAKDAYERTCGCESGPLRPAGANSAFKIQYSKFRITRSGCSLRKARQVRQRTAGLRRRRLRPAGLFETEFVGNHFHHNGHGCGPPPSSRSHIKHQRLQAAERCAIKVADKTTDFYSSRFAACQSASISSSESSCKLLPAAALCSSIRLKRRMNFLFVRSSADSGSTP